MRARQTQITFQAAYRQRRAEVALREITERMAGQFPEIAPERIAQLVRGRYAAFDNGPIREFVPIFVERSTREALAARRAAGP